MLGHGKLCRYELHHPMSLSDVFAALFRPKPKKAQPVSALLGLGQRPEPEGAEPAVPEQTNESREAVETVSAT
ncbi:MAG TPA: hypothetical protein VG267_22545 [Terracidiphilus sp.]|jgi:hypothetical protein|nr:hypothetical protein [Terracidiphilus sp.]